MQIFANNATSTLADAITNVAVVMSVQAGHGARFPNPVGGDFFLVTLFELIDGVESNHEVVKCTARAIDTLTIVRAQETTTARAWGVGAQISHRATAGTIAALPQLAVPNTFAAANTFSVSPIVPTAAPGDNTTKASSTAFVTAAVSTAIAALVASSPAALDTLNEFALALGNDANFATTTATSLGNRLRFDTAAQGLTAPQKVNALTNLGIDQINNTSDANKPVSTAVQTALNLKAPLASPSFTGGIISTSGSATVRGIRVVGSGVNQGTVGFGSFDDAYKISGGSDYSGMTFDVAVSKVFAFTIGGVEAARISGAGNLLSGTSADNGVDRVQIVGSVTATGTYKKVNAAATSSQFMSVTGSTTASTYGNITNTGASFALGVESSGGASVFPGGAVYASVLGTTNATMLQFATNNAVRMSITAGGNLLIGTATDNGTDILQVAGAIKSTGNISAVNSAAIVSMTVDGIASGTNGGSSVNARLAGVTSISIGNKSAILGGAYDATPFLYSNSAISTNFGFNITAPPVSGGVMSWRAGSDGTRGTGFMYSDGGGAGVADLSNGIGNGIYWSTTGGYVTLQTGGNERVRVDSAGNLLVGATSGGNHVINKASTSEGGLIMSIQGAGNAMGYFQDARGSGANGANSGLVIYKNNGTGRSINASGTINASGADYAEYMRKTDTCEAIEKGDVVGVTADGLLTKTWDEAVTFVVKTTNPSYVGGDTWGTEEALGVAKPNDAEHPDYEADFAAHTAALEAARTKVDRIAFAGQVPVNVFHAKPGQYIVPGRFGNIIGGVAVNPEDMTLPMYLRAVGVVQNILPDGRANIRVKVA